MDISIVGAGPVGSYAGYLLARQGHSVNVYEEHKKIGLPIQCTGIVTSALSDIIKPKKEFVINRIKRARIFSPNNYVEFDLKKDNLIIDRHKFDCHIAEKARQAGAKIYLGSKFLENSQSKIKIKEKNKRTNIKETDLIVGADGPCSQVAKSNNMYCNRKFWLGIQARVKLKNDNLVEYYPHIASTAWVVPEDEYTARIGLMARLDRKNTRQLFNTFLRNKINIKNKKKIIEYQGGLIPVFNPRQRLQSGNAFLIGDAALQVKATTGGGLVQGLRAAENLSESIISRLSYEKRCNRLKRQLKLHLFVRKTIDRFNSNDWEKLIKIVKNKKIKSIIETKERDHISSLLIRALIAEPKLMFFAKYLL